MNNYDEKKAFRIYTILKNKLYICKDYDLKWLPQYPANVMSYEDFLKHCEYTHNILKPRKGWEKIK